jgi:hypothetical protein
LPEELISNVFVHILSRLDDEETTVVDLALKTLNEIWFTHPATWENMNVSQKKTTKARTAGICHSVNGSPKIRQLMSRLFEKVKAAKVTIDCLVEMCADEHMAENSLAVLELLSQLFSSAFTEHLTTLQPLMKASVIDF